MVDGRFKGKILDDLISIVKVELNFIVNKKILYTNYYFYSNMFQKIN